MLNLNSIQMKKDEAIFSIPHASRQLNSGDHRSPEQT